MLSYLKYCIFLGLLIINDLYAERMGPSNWRFYNSSDGLEESWSGHISLGREGKIWIAHGGVDSMSWTDGRPTSEGKYFHKIPSPGLNLKVQEGMNGELWAIHSNGIQRFEKGRWKKYFINNFSTITQVEYSDVDSLYPGNIMFRTTVPLIPSGMNRVLYLQQDGLLSFDAKTQKSEDIIKADQMNLGQFIDMNSTKDGSIWITAERGIAKLRLKSGKTIVQWREYNVEYLGIKNVRLPIEDRPGELSVMALNTANNKNELIHFDGTRLSFLADHEGNSWIGWLGSGSNYWVIKDKGVLTYVQSGNEKSPDKNGILSSYFHGFAVEPSGVFWLATTHGIARHAPSIWKSLEDWEDSDPILSIYEDSMGRLWFASVYYLLLYQDGDWEKFPLPKGYTFYSHSTQSLSSLKDGRIVFNILPFHDFLLTFNPKNRKFEKIRYARDDSKSSSSEYYIRYAVQRSNGTLWVQSFSASDSLFRLEIFDGKSFKPYLELGTEQDMGTIRNLVETRNGDLWIGALIKQGPVLFKDGRYKTFGPDDGYFGSNVFSICELRNGNVWFGGRGDIWEYDGDNWELVHTGLSTIRTMIQGRDGTIWVATGTGIHRYANGSWVTNTFEDGLPNTAAFSIAEDRAGRIWAGTISGISLYNGDADRDPPQTFISSTENLLETPPDGEGRIIFNGYDKWKHTRTERLLFSYSLDNHDWTPYKANTVAVFTKLEPGKHNFKARAMDVNFNRDPSPASWEFTVLLPWYKEIGFLIVVSAGGSIILFLLGFAVYRHVLLEKLVVDRTRKLHNANIQLQENVSELKTAEETLNQKQTRLELTLKHERLIARIASRMNFSNVFFEIIDEMMENIGEATGIDQVALYAFEPEEKRASCFGLWTSPSCNKKNSDISPSLFSRLPQFTNRLIGGDKFYAVNLQEFDQAEADCLRQNNIEAFCFFPIETLDKKIGCIMFSHNHEYYWKSEEFELFNTVADIIANAWKKHIHLQARLEADEKRIEAMHLAEKASRLASVGVMAAGITHEINQPLSTINFSVEMLNYWDKCNEGFLPNIFKDRLVQISASIRRIDKIINHMKSFWIPQSQITNEEVQLNQVVKKALSLISRQLRSHNIELKFALASSLHPIIGNSVYLEQVVINLAVNAMHSLDQVDSDNKKLLVKSWQEGSEIFLEVEDNGVGIPGGAEEKIFDLFFSTKKPSEGTGLGLAIVKRFIDCFQGTIVAKNNNAGGATFSICFPVPQKEDTRIENTRS